MDVQDEEKRSKGAEGGVAGSGLGRATGICERCGRETDTLYSVQGRKMCSSCYTSGSPSGAESGGAPLLSIIVERVAIALGVRQKPRVIPTLPPGKISMRTLSEKDDKERQRKSTERFNLKERRMMQEEEGQLGIEKPLTDGHRKERKPSPEAKKQFFSQHSEEKK